MKIYLARNQQQAGPYTLEDLNTMLGNGQVQLTDLMWHKGMSQWQPVGQVTGDQLVYQPAPDLVATPVTTAQPLSLDKPAQTAAQPLDKLAQPAAQPTVRPAVVQHELASIGQRVLAKVIDSVLTMATLLPLLSQMDGAELSKQVQAGSNPNVAMMEALQGVAPFYQGLSVILSLLLLLVQIILLVRRGQTLGKLVMGIWIADHRQPVVPSAWRLVGIRFFLFNFFYNLAMMMLPVGLGLLLANLYLMSRSPKRQTIHDWVAGTLVLKGQPVTQPASPTVTK